jgi:hypothetical protein
MAAVACLFVVRDYLRGEKNFWPHLGAGVAGDAAVSRALARIVSLLPD